MVNLTLVQRLKFAAKIAVGIFDQQSATAARGMLAGIFSGAVGSAPIRATVDLLDTYNQSPWAHACAGRVADAIASTHWRLYAVKSKRTGAVARNVGWLAKAAHPARRTLLKQVDQAGELREIQEHVLLDMLRNANGVMTGLELRWLTSVWLDLVGDAFYVKERNKLGVPAALWPVPPHWVAETPTPQHPFYRVSWRGWQGAIPQTEMLWLSHPNPVNPYGRGSGVAKAIDDELQADEYAARHTLAYFRNSARPDLLVMPKEGGYLDPDERDRLHTWWTDNLQGVWRRFKPLFLTRPMDVTVLQQSLRDMVLPELRQMERDLIVSVWGVTPEVIGIIGNSNRATIREARPLFATYCLTPRLERMREALQSRLVPEYDEALILDYDSVIPEDREFKLKAMQSFPWAWDGNEMRQLAGDSPEPEMDGVRMQPSAYIPFGAEPVSPTGLFPKLENLTDEELRQLYGLLSKAERKELTDATR